MWVLQRSPIGMLSDRQETSVMRHNQGVQVKSQLWRGIQTS